MKKLINIFVFVAATAMALVSCQKNEIENPADENKEYVYTFLIGDADASDEADSKATIGDNCVEWTSGDKIGTFTKSANAYSNVTVAEGIASFSIYSNGGLSAGEQLYFYYPYDSDAGKDETAVSMSIPTNQSGVDDMPMASLPFTVTEESATNNTAYAGEIRFANLGSVIEFNIYTETAEYASEVIKSVTFEADNALAGDFTFDLTSVDYSEAKRESTLAITGHEEKSVTSTLETPVAVPTTKDAAAIVKMVVAPGSHAGNIVVTTDKADYTYTLPSREFKRSSVKPIALKLREDVREGFVVSQASLTSDEIKTKIAANKCSYGTMVEYNDAEDGVVWKSTCLTDAASRPWLQMKSDKAVYIAIEADSYITEVVVTVTGASNSAGGVLDITKHTAFAGNLSLNTSSDGTGTTVASGGATDNLITLVPTGDHTTLYLKTSAGARVWNVEVTKSGAVNTEPSIGASDILGISARGVEAQELEYVIVNPDGSELSVEGDGEIVIADLSEDKIVYSVTENTTDSEREGTITITYGDLVQVVKVSQQAPVFTTSQTEIILEADAEASKSFTVTSDFDWDAALSENAGFTVSPASYVWEEDTDANPGKQSVRITASAANGSEEGTLVLGTVTFTSTTGQTLEVTVKQESSYMVEGAAEESLTFSDIYTVNTILESVTVDAENFAVSFAKNDGGTNPQYYASSTSVRLYSKNTLTISSTKTIVNIELTFASGENSNAISTDVGTYSNGTWTGSANSVTFTVGGTSGHRRIATIKVYYLGGGSGETSELQERNLAFSAAAATATVDEDFTEPTLSGATDGVVYSSSNTAVAEVDSETGEVTLKAAGTTTITAAAEADATYKAGEASYTLTVSAGGTSSDETWTLVIDKDDLVILNSSESSTYNKYKGVQTATAQSSLGNTMDVQFYIENVMVSNDKGLQFKASTGLLYTTTSLGAITNVEVDVNSGDAPTVTIGSSENPTTAVNRGAYVSVKRSSSGVAHYNKITITFQLN